MVADSQSEVIDFLSRPESYGISEPVQRIDTHISIVFLAGDRAYKLKRAVRFSYLDYADPESRCRFCHDEVAVNRRTAPLLYEGVEAVVRGRDGSLSLGGDGEPVDWLVVMKRFDQESLWDSKARRGELTPPKVNILADSIAEFHQIADVHRKTIGGAAIQTIIEENRDELARFVPAVFDGRRVEQLSGLSEQALAACRELLDHRAATGAVRRCHGDLHLRNICEVDGRPLLFDAIEFSDGIAVVDVLYDLAFLIMDLEHHGLRPLANLAMNRYLSLTRDYEGLAAMPLFIATRAGVRAHVVASAMQHAARPEDAASEARRFLDLAIASLDAGDPQLIAIGGLSGTGKSTLARQLAADAAPVPGAVHLQSDIIRKRLAGVAPETRLSETYYAEDVTQRVYGQMRHDAARALAAGYSVIADATFLDPVQRRGIEEMAAEADVPFVGLWLHASIQEMERRLEARRGDASDAAVDVLHLQLRSNPSDIDWIPVCAGPNEEATFRAAQRAISRRRTVAADTRPDLRRAKPDDHMPQLEAGDDPETRPTGTCPK